MIEINDSNRKLFSLACGRADASRMGVISDPWAEKIEESLRGGTAIPQQGKYISIFLSIRARVMDEVTEEFIHAHPGCTVIHLGCGLDSRYERIQEKPAQWIDLDFPQVIELRKQFYEPKENYRTISTDANQLEWLEDIDASEALIVAEGFCMFQNAQENIDLFRAFLEKFSYSEYLMDVYTEKALVYANAGEEYTVRGKTIMWGLSDPKIMERIPGVTHLRTYDFNYPRMVRNLPLLTRIIYRRFYGKKSLNRLYRIYRFRLSENESN